MRKEWIWRCHRGYEPHFLSIKFDPRNAPEVSEEPSAKGWLDVEVVHGPASFWYRLKEAWTLFRSWKRHRYVQGSVVITPDVAREMKVALTEILESNVVGEKRASALSK